MIIILLSRLKSHKDRTITLQSMKNSMKKIIWLYQNNNCKLEMKKIVTMIWLFKKLNLKILKSSWKDKNKDVFMKYSILKITLESSSMDHMMPNSINSSWILSKEKVSMLLNLMNQSLFVPIHRPVKQPLLNMLSLTH